MATHRISTLSLAMLTVAAPIVAGIGVASNVLAAPPTTETDSDAASGSAMSVEETRAVIDVYVEALVAREDIAPYFSEDVVLDLVDIDQQIQGRDEVAAAIADLHEVAFDAHPEVVNVVVAEGTAVLEALFVATHTGEFAGIPATGKEIAVPYAVVYDLADGEITELRIYGFATGVVAALTAEASPATATSSP
jgi:steroid delta-isomerase-like uncharacterized protein